MPLILICVVPSVVPVLEGCRVPVEKDQLRTTSCATGVPKDRVEQLLLSLWGGALQSASLKTFYIAVINC